jgi:hypothetical protein
VLSGALLFIAFEPPLHGNVIGGGVARQRASSPVVVATRHGILAGQPRVLWDSNNTVVHLHPAPVVAKVAANERRSEGARALSRELAVAAHLAALGAPVAEPSPQLPSQVHRQDGLAMTFWRYYEQDRGLHVTSAAVADSLRELHRGLRSFPGALPDFRAGIPDAGAVFDGGHSRRLRRRDRDFIVEEHERLRAELDRLQLRLQPIHGSPQSYNRLIVRGSVRWIDLETVCIGPIEADIGFVGCRDAFPVADPRLLVLFAELTTANAAVACSARMDEAPALAWHAAHHLGLMRSRSLRRRTAQAHAGSRRQQTRGRSASISPAAETVRAFPAAAGRDLHEIRDAGVRSSSTTPSTGTSPHGWPRGHWDTWPAS